MSSRALKYLQNLANEVFGQTTDEIDPGTNEVTPDPVSTEKRAKGSTGGVEIFTHCFSAPWLWRDRPGFWTCGSVNRTERLKSPPALANKYLDSVFVFFNEKMFLFQNFQSSFPTFSYFYAKVWRNISATSAKTLSCWSDSWNCPLISPTYPLWFITEVYFFLRCFYLTQKQENNTFLSIFLQDVEGGNVRDTILRTMKTRTLYQQLKWKMRWSLRRREARRSLSTWIWTMTLGKVYDVHHLCSSKTTEMQVLSSN